MLQKLIALLELVFFGFGVSLPLLTLSEFWFLKNEISLINIIVGLYLNEEFALFFIVSVFGLVFPLIKIIGRIINVKVLDRFQLHKFAMLDIFLVSFVLFASKFSTFFSAKIDVGFYFLMVSVLLGFFQIMIKDERS